VRATNRQFGLRHSETTRGDGCIQQQDQQFVRSNHKHQDPLDHAIITFYNKNKLVPCKSINQENYFLQEHISNQSFFPIENISQSCRDCNEYEQVTESNSFYNNVNSDSVLGYQSSTDQSSVQDLDQFICSQQSDHSTQSFNNQSSVQDLDQFICYQQSEHSTQFFTNQSSVQNLDQFFCSQQSDHRSQSNFSLESDNTFLPSHSGDFEQLEEFEQYLLFRNNSSTTNSIFQYQVPQHHVPQHHVSHTFENYHLSVPTSEGTISVTVDLAQECQTSSSKKTNREKCKEYRNKKKERGKHLVEELERETNRNITLKFKLQEIEEKVEKWKKYILKQVKAQGSSKNNIKVAGDIFNRFCDI